MKRSIALILMVAAAGLLSISPMLAEGVQEGSEGAAGEPQRVPYERFEKLSVEGSVEFGAGRPELKTQAGEVYRLLYPRFLAEEIEVESGERISVEGFEVPGPRWASNEEERYLRVETVTLNGEEYELASRFGPGYGHPGPAMGGPGMRGGGYGPGSGYGCGSAYGHRGHMAPGRGGRGGQGNPNFQGGPQSRW